MRPEEKGTIAFLLVIVLLLGGTIGWIVGIISFLK